MYTSYFSRCLLSCQSVNMLHVKPLVPMLSGREDLQVLVSPWFFFYILLYSSPFFFYINLDIFWASFILTELALFINLNLNISTFKLTRSTRKRFVFANFNWKTQYRTTYFVHHLYSPKLFNFMYRNVLCFTFIVNLINSYCCLDK